VPLFLVERQLPSLTTDDLGLAPMQGFPLLSPTLNRPVFAKDRVRFFPGKDLAESVVKK